MHEILSEFTNETVNRDAIMDPIQPGDRWKLISGCLRASTPTREPYITIEDVDGDEARYRVEGTGTTGTVRVSGLRSHACHISIAGPVGDTE
jgi:hypothetical protein